MGPVAAPLLCIWKSPTIYIHESQPEYVEYDIQADPVAAPLFFFPFVFVMLFVTLNITIAIIMDGYTAMQGTDCCTVMVVPYEFAGTPLLGQTDKSMQGKNSSMVMMVPYEPVGTPNLGQTETAMQKALFVAYTFCSV